MKYLVCLYAMFASLPPLQGKTFIYCSEGSPESFNPQRTLSGTSAIATGPTIYDRLIARKYGTTELEPGLAESWEVSQDKTVFTFHLRKGVAFHKTPYFTPTRTFNADDVVFSIKRQMDPSHPYHKVGGGVYQYFQGMGMGDLISSVEKLGPHTVRIHLTRPEIPFLANLAMPFMSILSKEYADHLSAKKRMEDLDQLPIGTGPFMFRRYERDSIIRYRAHPKHWKGQPKFDSLVFAITTEPSVRLQKLKKKECHLAVYPSPTDFAAIRKSPDLRLAETNGMNISYLAMNIEKKPFDNRKVRQAIAHALDKKAYIRAVYLNKAYVAVNPFPPTMWSHNNDVVDYEHNPKKARQLLAEAGYPKGFSTTMWTLSVTRAFNPNGKKLGLMMQQDLAKVGINITLKSYDWVTYLDKTRRGEQEMLQLGWTGDNGDPDNFLYTLFSCDSVTRGSNNARYCAEPFNGFITRARSELDKNLRRKLYEQAQIAFKKDSPVVPVAHTKVYRAYRKEVKGYKMDPFDQENFFELDLK